MRPDERLVQTPTRRVSHAMCAPGALCVVWMLCIAVAATANAQQSTFDIASARAEYLLSPGVAGNCPVRVVIRPAPWLLIRSGYCPIVVRLRPVAGNTFLADGTFTIRFQNGYGTNQQDAIVVIPVQAGQPIAEKEILFNGGASSRNSNLHVECAWNGITQNHLQAMFYVNYSNVLASEPNQRLTLISDLANSKIPERNTAMAEVKNFQIPISPSCVVSSTHHSSIYWRTHFADVANLPKGWLRISAFDQVFADIEDLERLDAYGQALLKDFTWCGGTLMVGKTEDVERVKKLVAADWSRPLAVDSPFHGQVFNAGFGQVALSKSSSQVDGHLDENEMLSKSRAVRLSNDLGDEYWNWLIPEVGKTPVWTFFAFVVLVVGVAAPGILYWSQRVKRRIWIVLAIPALAIASTATLFLYGAIKDGWGSKVRIRSLTWIDSDGEGAVWSRQSYFAGSIPGNRLRIAPHVELIPLKSKRELRSIQYQSDTEQVYAGLLPLRQQRQFSITHPVRDLTVFRRGVDIDATLGQSRMLNALEVPILGAVYCNREGQIFQSTAVQPGEPMAWQASTKGAASEWLRALFNQQPLVVPDDAPDRSSRSMLEIFISRYSYWNQPIVGLDSFVEESRWRDALTEWDKDTPGKFVVFVERAPHVERCLPDCKETNSLHTIVGQW